MNDAEQIHSILIDRDISAFVASDWDTASQDFDGDAFTAYAGDHGVVRLRFPSLDDYRVSWLSQAAELSGHDQRALTDQLRAVQRIERLEVVGNRALATKVFDGEIELRGLEKRRLEWTTYYFLRLDEAVQRWLITGFVGYLPNERSMT